MYAIEISSKAFKGLSVVKQHRLVNDLLQDDIKKMHGIRVIIERIFFLRFFFL
jgi:BolA-like protein 3